MGSIYFDINVLDQVQDTVGVSAFVVIPRHKLDKVISQSNSSLGINNGRMSIRDEIRRDNILIGVCQNSLHRTSGSILDGTHDGFIGCTLVQACCQVNNRNIDGRNTERHTSQLSIQFRDNLSNSLGSSSGRRNDVVASSTSSTPVLLGRSINSLLGGSDSMDSGHQTFLQSKLIIDNLGKRGQTVGGAGSIGDNIHAGLILFLVDSHNEHGGISRRSRDDNLLGTSLHVGRGTFNGGEGTSGLNNIVNTGITPSNFGGVHFFKHSDGLSINLNGLVINALNSSRVNSVGGIMLEHVFHVFGSDERIVDSNNVDHRIVLCGTHDKTSDTSETVDTDVNRLQAVFRSLAVDNISKFRFEGGSTDQESINVFFGRKSRGSGGAGGSTVKDASFGGNVGSGNFAQVFTDIGVGVLCLLGSGGKTSSDSPDRFVGDNDIFPVISGEDIGVGLDLGENKIVGSSGFTVFQGFSAACKNLDSFVKSVFGLGSDLFVRFALFATFGVTDKSPLNSHVAQHLGTGFTGEGTVSLGPDILGTDGDIGTQVFFDALDMELRRANNNFGIGRQSRLVEHRNKFLGLRNGSVALPVTSDEEFTGFDLSGRVVGTGGHLRCRRDDGFSRLHLDKLQYFNEFFDIVRTVLFFGWCLGHF